MKHLLDVWILTIDFCSVVEHCYSLKKWTSLDMKI